MTVDVLSDLAIILDSDNTDLLNIYIRKATNAIANYLNIPTVAYTETDEDTGEVITIQPIDIQATYPDAVEELATIFYRNKGVENLKQYAQGSRSGTTSSPVDAVKDLLPLPYVSMK